MKLLIPILVLIASTMTLSAFADWRNFSLAANPSTIEYLGEHDSDSSGSGEVHTAFTIASDDKDQLSYLRTNVYFPPSGFTIAPFVTPIDIANNIANVCIKHNSGTGKTHFAYTRTRVVSFGGGGLLFLRDIRHAVLTPGNPESVEVETIASLSTFDGATSLSLAFGPGGEVGLPAVSFYDPTRKSLKYAKKTFEGTWPIEEVAIGTGDFPEDIGFNSDLGFSFNGNAGIVCEERRFGSIKYYWRDDSGTWQSNVGIPIDPLLPGDPITASRVQSQPSLFFEENTFSLTYTLTRDNSQEIVYRKFLLLGFSREVVDSVDSNGAVILPPTLADSSIGISFGRIVISYTKNTGGISAVDRPYVARGTSFQGDPSNFTKQALPLQSVNEKAKTALSFDHNFYPIITWNKSGGGTVVAAYCPDFIDDDGDGVNHLQEMAFRMNPNVRDSHLLPSASFVNNVGGEDPAARFLTLTFRTNNFGTVDPETQTLSTDLFLYSPVRSTSLRGWHEEPDDIRTVAESSPPPFPPDYKGRARTVTALGTPGIPREFLRVYLFRK